MIRTILTAIYATCFAISLSTGLAAQPVEPGALFEVRDVAIDATADNPVKARQTGLAEGRRAALDRLLDRLVPKAAKSGLRRLSDAEIGGLVETYALDGEKSSSTQYLATFNVLFSELAVRRLLKSERVPFSESRAKPVLILPVLVSEDTAILFDGQNDWLTAWGARNDDAYGLVPMFLPLGDLRDITTMSASAALAADKQAMGALAERYGVDRLFIARAIPGETGSGKTLRAVGTLYEDDEQDSVEVTVNGNADASNAALYDQAAALLAESLIDKWKDATALRFNEGEAISVAVTITNPGQWAKIRRALAAEPSLSRLTILSLTQDRAELELEFTGGVDGLRAALAQRDLNLFVDDKGGWQLALSPPN